MEETIANSRTTTRSETTTTPRTVRVTGPSAASSDRNATTTAGDWAAIVTPMTTAAANAWVEFM